MEYSSVWGTSGSRFLCSVLGSSIHNTYWPTGASPTGIWPMRRLWGSECSPIKGDIIAVFNYLEGNCREGWDRLFWLQAVHWSKGNSDQVQGKKTHDKHGYAVENIAQKCCWPSNPEYIQNPVRSRTVGSNFEVSPTPLSRVCTRDLQRSLPAKIILWFCIPMIVVWLGFSLHHLSESRLENYQKNPC